MKGWRACGELFQLGAGRSSGCDAEDEAGQQGKMLVTRLEMMRASKAGNDSGDEAELASLTKREGVESLWRALPTRSWKIQRLQERRARTASKTGEQERRARPASKNGEQERRCGRRRWVTRQKMLATRLETRRVTRTASKNGEQERRARAASKSGELRANS